MNINCIFVHTVVILNTDGKTFTLLENPQAMRLKKAGYSKFDVEILLIVSLDV
jgi:hypothetical protein